MKSAKKITTVLMITIILITTNGCAIHGTLGAGVGQHGTQAINNIGVHKPAGDHSTGNGAGFIQDDTLPGVIRALKSKSVQD